MTDTNTNPTNPSLVGSITRVSQALIGALPPAFLMLLILNIGFLGIVLWFLDDQLDQRMQMAKLIISHCFDLVKK